MRYQFQGYIIEKTRFDGKTGFGIYDWDYEGYETLITFKRTRAEAENWVLTQ